MINSDDMYGSGIIVSLLYSSNRSHCRIKEKQYLPQQLDNLIYSSYRILNKNLLNLEKYL